MVRVPRLRFAQSFSSMMALAPPPPLQMEATPLCPGFWRARARWAVMRVPEAPSGWPRLTAPPWMFT